MALGHCLEHGQQISSEPTTVHASYQPATGSHGPTPYRGYRQRIVSQRGFVCKAGRRQRRRREVVSGCRRRESKHGVVLTFVDIRARSSAYTASNERLGTERKPRQGCSDGQAARAAEAKKANVPRRAAVHAYRRTTDRQRGRGETTSSVGPTTDRDGSVDAIVGQRWNRRGGKEGRRSVSDRNRSRGGYAGSSPTPPART